MCVELSLPPNPRTALTMTISAASVRLMFDGERCEPDSTPLDLDMEDGDQIVSHTFSFAANDFFGKLCFMCRMSWLRLSAGQSSPVRSDSQAHAHTGPPTQTWIPQCSTHTGQAFSSCMQLPPPKAPTAGGPPTMLAELATTATGS